MSSTETAARTYAATWQEPDPAVRAKMIEACFAAEGRIVSRGTEIRGRAALAKVIEDFRADPRGLTARLASEIDVQGPLFRFRAVVERRDGTIVESFDAGEVDAEGRIGVLLTFGGPLP
jgi:hypothetical protein